MAKISKRQQNIIDFLSDNDTASRSDIEGYIKNLDDNFSKPTLIRDLNYLIQQNLVKKSGSARNTTYSLSNNSDLFRKIDTEKYFLKEVDERKIKYPYFNFEVFKNLKNLFSKDEIAELDLITKSFQDKVKTYSETELKKEYERILIELSWKSSKIEGNTYTLLDTELLIKENIEAKGHKKEEATMILNHKTALEYIFED